MGRFILILLVFVVFISSIIGFVFSIAERTSDGLFGAIFFLLTGIVALASIILLSHPRAVVDLLSEIVGDLLEWIRRQRGQPVPVTTREVTPTDRDVDRKRVRRIIQAVLILGLTVCVPIYMGHNLFGFSGMCLGAALGIFLAGRLFSSVTVYVPIWQGLTSLNVIGGKIILYGPGLHARFFWEQIEEKDHQSFRLVTVIHEETFPTRDAQMKVKFAYQWRPVPRKLRLFRGVDESTIDSGFTPLISDWISSQFGRKDGDSVKADQEAIGVELRSAFEVGYSRENQDDRDSSLLGENHYSSQRTLIEGQYGIEMVTINLADVDFSEDVQKARGAINKAESILTIVATLHGMNPEELKEKKSSGAITEIQYQEMLNSAMTISGDAKKTIQDFGGSAAQALVELLARLSGR